MAAAAEDTAPDAAAKARPKAGRKTAAPPLEPAPATAGETDTGEDDWTGEEPQPEPAPASLEAALARLELLAQEPGPAQAGALNRLAIDWRAGLAFPGRLDLARDLWRQDLPAARTMAAKLLTQARIRQHEAEVWDCLLDWLAGADDRVLADLVASAAGRRLEADPARTQALAVLVASDNPLARRAALRMTLPLANLPHPKPADLERREEVLAWLADLAPDPDTSVQYALLDWLRALARRDPDRLEKFLETSVMTLPKGSRKAAKALHRDPARLVPPLSPKAQERAIRKAQRLGAGHGSAGPGAGFADDPEDEDWDGGGDEFEDGFDDDTDADSDS